MMFLQRLFNQSQSVSVFDGALSPRHYKFAHGLFFMLALMLVLAMFVPRFLGYGPAIIGLVGFLAARPVFGVWPRLPRFAVLWSLFILALMGLSSLWAVDPDFALERTGKSALVFLGGNLLLSLALFMPRELLRIWPRYVLTGGVIALGLLCFEFLSDGAIYKLLRGLGQDTPMNFSGLNRSVITLVIFAFVMIAAMRSAFSGARMYAALGLFALAMVFVLTQTSSQSAQVSLALGVLFLLAFPYRCKASWLALGGAITAGALATPWIAQVMFSSLPEITERYDWFQHSYAADRMEIWDFISRRALESPVIGHGVEATRAITDFDTAMIYHTVPTILHPHNLFVQAWIEFGVIGAVMASAFFITLFYQIARLPVPAARIALAGLMTCLSAASISYGLWQGWWLGLFWMLAACTVLSIKMLQQDRL